MFKKISSNTLVFILFILILLGFELYALKVGSHYSLDSFIMIGVMGIVFLLRKKIHLHPVHFALFGIVMVLHNLGVFGFYGKTPWGLEYDYWVHGYFGLIFSWILIRAHVFNKILSTPIIYVFVIFFVLGFSAAHELVEYQGAMTFGEGEGFIFFGIGDK